MSKTEMIRARIEPVVKEQAEKVFSALGLSPTQAISMFYRQSILHQGIPFSVRLPNAETQEAMLDVLMNRQLQSYGSVGDMMKKLGSDAD